jgi:hypothetical protein
LTYLPFISRLASKGAQSPFTAAHPGAHAAASSALVPASHRLDVWLGGATEAMPPVIDAVGYSGNHKISTAIIERGATIKPGTPISRALVGDEIRRIIALYKQSGFELSIAPNIQHPAAGHVTVQFMIDENGKGGDSGAAPAGGPPAGGAPPGAGPPCP